MKNKERKKKKNFSILCSAGSDAINAWLETLFEHRRKIRKFEYKRIRFCLVLRSVFGSFRCLTDLFYLSIDSGTRHSFGSCISGESSIHSVLSAYLRNRKYKVLPAFLFPHFDVFWERIFIKAEFSKHSSVAHMTEE